MAIGKNAMIRFADEKPKQKTPARKPGRLKVSDGAKALAAFDRTAAKRNRRASQPADRIADNEQAERPLADTASDEAVTDVTGVNQDAAPAFPPAPVEN
jgi:hypothetical protein